jgi:hypothetical protein
VLWPNTAVRSPPPPPARPGSKARAGSKKSLLKAFLQEAQPPRIDPPLRERIRELLAPVSDSYLRRLLRDSGCPLHPLVEGIRQDSLDSLYRTLAALTPIYREGHAKAARALVIEAKDHARLAARRSPHPDSLREEMIRWMIVWLESPELFETWARLRRPEYEKLAQQKIHESRGDDRGDVGGQIRHSVPSDEHAHHDQVRNHRNKSRREVESKQTDK